MREILHEVRLAARQILRRPMVGMLAVLSLALGIGFNTTVFTLVDGILHGGPPLRDPERLVDVYLSDRGGFQFATLSWPETREIRDRSKTFSELAAFQFQVAAWDDGEHTRMLLGEEVSASYFDVLGIQPAIGRGFEAAEDDPGVGRVVVLGDRFWRRELAADPDVLGKSLRLSGVEFTIIGVAPPELTASKPLISSEYWIPLGMHDLLAERPALEERGHRSLLVRARLADGVAPSQAQAELDTMAAHFGDAYPELFGERAFTVVPTRDVMLNPGIDAPVTAVAGGVMVLVGMVLLIACSNIANILLARAADRRREMAVRLAIGAGRWRLVRQLLTESVLLGLLGAAGGLALAQAALHVVAGFQPDLPFPVSLTWGALDLRALGFTLAVALGTGILCGLAPSLQASSPRLVPALKDAQSSLGKSHRRFGLRNILVVSQVAVSTLLLLGAGLFVRSLSRATSIDPGFDLRHGAAVSLAVGLGGRATPEEAKLFLDRVYEGVTAIPGVRSAAYAESLPLSLMSESRGYELEDRPVTDDNEMVEVMTTTISPGYLRTMGIDLRQGRDITESDTATAPKVVLVNETFAGNHWPNENAIGKRMRFGSGEDVPWHEVVGVVADGKYLTLGEDPRDFVYRAFAQSDPFLATIIVAADTNEPELLAQIRSVIEGLDRDVPIFGVRAMSQHLALMLFPARMAAALLAAFGLFGLALAAVGLYGVVAYSVARRTREIGIRVALGANRPAILKLVVREGMALVAVGLVLGISVAAFATKLLSSLLYGIAATDPATFVVVPLLLVLVALVANLLPARRALEVTPTEALRYE